MTEPIGPRSVPAGPVVLGGARTAVIVPIVATDDDELASALQEAAGKRIDILEWRLDAYAPQLADDAHRAAILSALPGVRARLRGARQDGGDIALLVTCRSAEQGGLRDHDPSAALALVRSVITCCGADLVDIEALREGLDASEAIAEARGRGVRVFASHHDFAGTPGSEEMLAIIAALRGTGADVAKLAVMPQEPEDVIRLLRASTVAAGGSAGPLVAIAMGPLGAVTRLSGRSFGSCATFAALGRASAPGQIALEHVLAVLDAIERDR